MTAKYGTKMTYFIHFVELCSVNDIMHSEDDMKASKKKEDMAKEYDFSKGTRGRFYKPKKTAKAIKK